MLLRIDTVFKVCPCFKHNSFVCKNESILEMTILSFGLRYNAISVF